MVIMKKVRTVLLFNYNNAFREILIDYAFKVSSESYFR
jgi:hypothetical protein